MDAKKIAIEICTALKKWKNRKAILKFNETTRLLHSCNGRGGFIGASPWPVATYAEAKAVFEAVKAVRANYGVTAVSLHRIVPVSEQTRFRRTSKALRRAGAPDWYK